MITYKFPHSYTAIFQQLQKRLAAGAPGFVQLLTGPRQVGKTTLLLQLAEELGVQCAYVAADSPEASLSGWWEQVWQAAEARASRRKAYLFIDEIQYMTQWSRLLKAQIDRIRRLKIPLHIVLSGSSAIQLNAGSRETMAGRFEHLHIRHWPAGELVEHFGIKPAKAIVQTLLHGTYPGAIRLMNELPRWRAYIRESIIDPAIGRDLMMTETIRKPALLRQVFALCIGHPAEIISLQKLCGQLMEKGALQTVAHYLYLLEQANLVAAVHSYSTRALRLRSSPPKLITLNQAMLASMESILPPTQESEPARFGRWVENACIACAWNAGQSVCYWRAEPLEVDCILQGSWGNWAIEVKTGHYKLAELAGLFEFCKIHTSFKPLILCDAGCEQVAQNAGIKALNWKDYLLKGIL
jgi:predicted AAA+ superfamily ATPase